MSRQAHCLPKYRFANPSLNRGGRRLLGLEARDADERTREIDQVGRVDRREQALSRGRDHGGQDS